MREYATPLTLDLPSTGSLTDDVLANARDVPDQVLFDRRTDAGWVGVTSDYVGLGTAGPHPYLVGPSEARNVLDSLRAAHAIPELDLSDTTLV